MPENDVEFTISVNAQKAKQEIQAVIDTATDSIKKAQGEISKLNTALNINPNKDQDIKDFKAELRTMSGLHSKSSATMQANLDSYAEKIDYVTEKLNAWEQAQLKVSEASANQKIAQTNYETTSAEFSIGNATKEDVAAAKKELSKWNEKLKTARSEARNLRIELNTGVTELKGATTIASEFSEKQREAVAFVDEYVDSTGTFIHKEKEANAQTEGLSEKMQDATSAANDTASATESITEATNEATSATEELQETIANASQSATKNEATEKITEEVEEQKKTLEEVGAEADAVLSKMFDSSSASLGDLKRRYKELYSVQKEIETFEPTGIPKELDTQYGQIATEIAAVKKAMNDFNKSAAQGAQPVDNSLSGLIIQLNKLNQQYSILQERGQDTAAIEQEIYNVTQKIDEAFVFDMANASLLEVKQHLQELETALKTVQNSEDSDALSELYARLIPEIDRVKTQFNALKQSVLNADEPIVDTAEETRVALQGVIDTAERVNQKMRFDGANVSIAELLRRLQELNAAKKTLEDLGLPREMDYRYEQLSQMIATTNAQLTEAKRRFTDVGEASRTASSEGVSFGSTIKTGATTAKAALGGLPALVKSIKSGFTSLNRTSNKVTSTLGGLASSAKSNFKSMLTSLTKYVLGFRSLFFLVRRLKTYVGEGIQNIVQWNDGDNEVNEAITDLLTSLLYLKNAWAAAFSPIITYVRPWLTSLIDTIADVGNTIARFIGALTGQEIVFNAVRVQAEDYADSLDDTGSSASGAADEVENLTDRLAAFDDLNVLGKDNDDNGSGSGGGSGSDDTYSPDPDDMFELVESEQSGLIAMLVDAWNNADFSGVGAAIKDKIIDALTLDDSTWATIKENVTKAGTSLGTFLVGLLGDEELWTTAGSFVANCFNIITEAIAAFLDTTKDLDWGGNAAAGLNTFLSDSDWKGAGENINEFFNQITGNINSFLSTLNEEDAAKAMTDFLNGLNLAQLTGQVFSVSVHLVATAITITAKALANASDDLASWLQEEATKVVTLKIVDENGKPLEVSSTDKDWTTDPVGAAVDGILFSIGQYVVEDLLDASTIAEIDLIAQLLQDIHDFFLGGKSEVTAGTVFDDERAKDFGVKIREGFEEGDGQTGPTKPVSAPAHVSGGSSTSSTSATGKYHNFWEDFWSDLDDEDFWQRYFTSYEKASKTYEKIWNDTEKTTEVVKGSHKSMKDDTDQTWTDMNTTTTTLWGSIQSTVETTVGGLKESVSTRWGEMKANVDEKWGEIKTSIITKVGEIRTSVGEKITSLKSTFATAWDNIKSNTIGIITDIKLKMVEIFNGIQNAIKPPLNGIITAVEGMVNKVLLAINTLIDRLNDMPDMTFTNPFTGTDYTLGWNIPRLNYVHLPRLAQGAVIPPNKEFMAVLGDQKSGTNIEAPLDTIKQAVAEELSEQIGVLQEGFASVVQAINSKELAIGDKQIGQASARYNAQQARIRGVNW